MSLLTLLSAATVKPQRRAAVLKQSTVAAVLRLAVILMILAIAVGLRVTDLNALGYNSDEAVYAGQGASIAQVPVLNEIFPVFRAHPLLFQFILAVGFKVHFSDLLGRLMSAAIGVATVYLVYLLGKKLYGERAGLIAALILAVMPYHVIVTRQTMLDGPMVFFATLSLYLLAQFATSQRRIDLIACGAALGLSFLSKEISIILLGAVYAFLAISPEIRVRISDIALSFAAMVMVILPFPLAVRLAGGGGAHKTQQYLVWQLFRRPNHTWDFYPTVVPLAIGLPVIVAAVLGLWVMRRRTSWREKLLMLWILVPIAFFQMWPTKGFQYLLPIAPAFALLAARVLTRWPEGDLPWRRWIVPQAAPGIALAALIVAGLFVDSMAVVKPSGSATFLAGTGGVPGGREAGTWVVEHVPEGATFMTIGPSMANIIKFYGRRQAYGVSVSPNPLHRNPSYEPINNPDFLIRTGELQYAVWDAFSAQRSTFFSERLLGYVHKYNGRVLHVETVTVTNEAGFEVEKPVIVIYSVRP